MTSACVFHLLAYPVKCNDRIIYRVTDYGENSGDKGYVNLQPCNAENATIKKASYSRDTIAAIAILYSKRIDT